MIALIAGVIISSVSLLGRNTEKKFACVGTSITTSSAACEKLKGDGTFCSGIDSSCKEPSPSP